MARLIITRVQYCEDCFKARRPNKGLLFVTVGRKRQKHQVRVATLNGTVGYTPHIIEMHGQKDGMVTFTSYCSIEDCGCKLTWKENVEKFHIQCIKYTSHIVTIKEWNSLVLFTGDENYWLD